MVPAWLRTLGFDVIRAMVYGLVIILLLIGATFLLGSQRTEQDTLHANLAQACVLSLPVTERGRDPEDVQRCFTQYGLQAPLLQESP